MSNYYYSSDYMHCSQSRCPRHTKCWRYQLGIDIKKKESTIASFYMPSPDKDLSDCEYFIDKIQYKIDKPKENPQEDAENKHILQQKESACYTLHED